MKPSLIQYLACPVCGGSIELFASSATEDTELMEGELSCSSCQRRFPVVGGIPRFVALENIEADKAATAANFGWQWQHFTQEDEKYADQFLGCIAPVTPEFFRDKIVLEGGCGKGRHTQLAAGWGAKEVIGVDLSAAVETAFAATRHLKNVHIIQADIYHLPVKREVDYAFSVGVLHHLPDPQAGFVSLASKVKSGGHLTAWIYGAENNEWITNWVSPLRERLTSRMNPRALLHFSKVPAALVYLATKLIYRPLNQVGGGAVARHLFYNDYLMAISGFGWKEQHTIVFDHLVAPTAHYIPRSEFEQWWREVGAIDALIEWHNRNSWRGFGRV
jgi:SAM-dependent methyltransferase